jgi:hypothetical protein
MRRVVVTTVVRGAPVDAVSGRVYVVDVNTARVLGAAPIPETPWRFAGTNPRGGHRGGRGVATAGGLLALANADELHVYDRAWQPIAVLSHPLVGDIHEVAADEEGLWACSTRADTLVRLGWDGALRETWCWRDDPSLVAAFGYRTVAPLDRAVDYRDMRRVDLEAVNVTHPNGVRPVADGLLVSLGRVRYPSPTRRERVLAAAGSAAQAAVVGRPLAHRLRAERVRRFGADPQPGADRRGVVVHVCPGRPAEVVVERPLAKWPNHNVLEHGREIVLCETSRETVVAVQLDTGEERAVEVPGAMSFLRGLVWLDGDRFLAGSRRPPTLHVVDLASGHSEPLLALSDEWHEAVHDIAPLPDEWEDIPPSLGVASRGR